MDEAYEFQRKVINGEIDLSAYGGPGSGNFGHKGRPGKTGGSGAGLSKAAVGGSSKGDAASLKKHGRELDPTTAKYVVPGAEDRIQKAANPHQQAQMEEDYAIIRRSVENPSWRFRKEGAPRADVLGAEAFNFGPSMVMGALRVKGKKGFAIPKEVYPEWGSWEFSAKTKKFGKWLDGKLPANLNLVRS